MLFGAKGLGLNAEWRFGFASFGFHAETTSSAVSLDVGGGLGPGVLDHPADSGSDNSASLALANHEAVYNHLLGPLLERITEGHAPEGATWCPTIVTPGNLDWDGMAAAWLVMRLVEDGDIPAWGAALEAYSLDVYQRRCHIDPKEASSVPARSSGISRFRNWVPRGGGS